MCIDTRIAGRIAAAAGLSAFTLVAAASSALAQSTDLSDDSGLYDVGGSILLLAAKALGIVAIGVGLIALSRRHQGKLTSRRAEEQLSARLRERGNHPVVLPASVYEQEYDRALAVKAPSNIHGTFTRPAEPVTTTPGMVGLLGQAPQRPAGPPHGMPTPPPQLHRPHPPVVSPHIPPRSPAPQARPIRPGQYPAWPAGSPMPPVQQAARQQPPRQPHPPR
jgi:hypothetical protein